MAERSFGSKLEYKASGGGSYTTVSNATSIGFPAPEIDEIEVTNHDSVGGYREFLPGLKDGGTVDFEGIVSSDSVVTGLQNAFDGTVVYNWKITTRSGAVWTFDGYMASFGEGAAEIDSARTYTGSIRVSGKPTFTAASS